jgi:hypothetical protein
MAAAAATGRRKPPTAAALWTAWGKPSNNHEEAVLLQKWEVETLPQGLLARVERKNSRG